MKSIAVLAILIQAFTLTACDSSDSPSSGAFADSRDNKTYKWVKIGKQIWMAENLNYTAKGSKCYADDSANCEIYGRYYDWATAKTACPAGWHLPTKEEWDKLIATAENEKVGGVGNILKAKAGWSDDNGQSGDGTDDYGFSALPGGYGYSDGYFSDAGYGGYWWSGSDYETSNSEAYHIYIYYATGDVAWHTSELSRASLFSVRCVKNDNSKPAAAALPTNAAVSAIAYRDYSSVLQTHFPKGTLGESGKTRPVEMFFQKVHKSGRVYSVSGNSKTKAAEDAFSGTLTISASSKALGDYCGIGENEIKGSYDLSEKESKTSGHFVGSFIACENHFWLKKASFKGSWVKHSNGEGTPCNFGL